MRRVLVALAVALTLGASVKAVADQCWAMTPEQTKKAAARVSQLKPGDIVLSYCEPCGMKQPEKIVVKTVGPEDSINGKSEDAAYIFLPDGPATPGPRKFVNLAKIAGCPTTGVSPSVTVDPATLKEVVEEPKPAAPKVSPADEKAMMEFLGGDDWEE